MINGPVGRVTWARARAPPLSRLRGNICIFLRVQQKRFLIVFCLKHIKNEGIRRFHRSDEIRREKSHLLVCITV